LDFQSPSSRLPNHQLQPLLPPNFQAIIFNTIEVIPTFANTRQRCRQPTQSLSNTFQRCRKHFNNPQIPNRLSWVTNSSRSSSGRVPSPNDPHFCRQQLSVESRALHPWVCPFSYMPPFAGGRLSSCLPLTPALVGVGGMVKVSSRTPSSKLKSIVCSLNL
jgi:hypothetical protein